MKNFKLTFAWVIQLLLPVAALIYPQIGTPSEFVAAFATLGGVVLLIATITEGLKELFKYNSYIHWKGWPLIISSAAGILLSMLGQAMAWGFYEVFSLWQSVIVGIILTGLAQRWYNTDFGYLLIKLLFGIELKK